MTIGLLTPCDEFTLPATGVRYKFIVNCVGTPVNQPNIGSAWCYNLTTCKTERLKRKTPVENVVKAK